MALATPASALNIALTNDDGYNALGIQVMKSALEAAGHTVTLAASLTDQSGGSMAFDQGPLKVRKEGDRTYSVALAQSPTIGAKPSNCAYVALAIAAEGGQPVDLLISRINTSANIGLNELISGTVGAAVHAVTAPLNGPVPAIAVGTEEPDCDQACKQAHYQIVANFMVSFVAHLETKPGFLASEEGLLPRGVALVISYPGTAAVAGVRVAVQSDVVVLNGSKVSGAMTCLPTSCSSLALGATRTAAPLLGPDSSLDIKDSDYAYFKEGYITIVPVAPSITVKEPLRFKSILPGLSW
jgi:3-phytase